MQDEASKHARLAKPPADIPTDGELCTEPSRLPRASCLPRLTGKAQAARNGDTGHVVSGRSGGARALSLGFGHWLFGLGRLKARAKKRGAWA